MGAHRYCLRRFNFQCSRHTRQGPLSPALVEALADAVDSLAFLSSANNTIPHHHRNTVTTPTDYRALCSELADALHSHTSLYEGHECELVTRARTALAQSEPEGLTKEELEKLADDYMLMDGADGTMHLEHIDFARAAIAADRARWGRHAIKPVPINNSQK